MQADDVLHHAETGLVGLPEDDVGALAVEQGGVGAGCEEELGPRGVRTSTPGHHQLSGKVPVGPSEDAAFVAERRLVGDRVTRSRVAGRIGVRRPALNDVDARIGAEKGGAVVIPPAGERHEVVGGVGCVLGVEIDDDLALGRVEHCGVTVSRIDAHRLRTGEIKGARAALVGCRAVRIRRLGDLNRLRGCRGAVGLGRGGLGCGGLGGGRRRNRIELRLVVPTVHEPGKTGQHDHDDSSERSQADHPTPGSGLRLGRLSRGDAAGSVELLAGAFLGTHSIAGYRRVRPTPGRSGR